MNKRDKNKGKTFLCTKMAAKLKVKSVVAQYPDLIVM